MAFAFLLLACVACQGKKDPIQQLQRQATNDSIVLHEIQERYQESLRADFLWCDSMLMYVPEEYVDDYFNTLNLAQAYLNQFDETLPSMVSGLAQLQHQLATLQSDVETHYLSDSLAAVYLRDEAAEAELLHQRVLYFQDRLSKQAKELQGLKKNILKLTSP